MTSHHAKNHLPHIRKQEERFGPESREVALALKTLCALICRDEDPSDAVPFFERCIAIKAALDGPESILPDLDAWINQTNSVSFKHTEPFVLRRLEIEANALGEIDPRIADQCDAIADSYRNVRRYADAATILKRSLAIKEKLFGADSAETAAALQLLAETCLQAEQKETAEQYLERCITTTERVFGPRSRELAKALVSLAIACADASSGQKPAAKARSVFKASDLFARGLGILEELFGSDGFEVRKALAAMIRSFQDIREFWQAEPLLTRMLSTSERVHGTNSAALLWILIELSDGYARKGSRHAEPFIRRSFETMKTFLDASSPSWNYGITESPGDGTVLDVNGPRGLLEKLIEASENARRHLRRRWGA